ncbi:MAG: PBP1A family penicillin-binding protein [Corallincola sp.]|nr:PBP1A family penicillin-binding protein [Corallincola sp.]
MLLRILRHLAALLMSLIVLGIAALAVVYAYFAPQLPDAATLRDVRLQTPMQVFSADGQLLAQFGEQRRIPLTLEQMPPLLVQAFLATEDYRFYEHPGIDPIGVGRAMLAVVASGEKSQGASTITMQLARNFFLGREKTYIRKIKEIFLAWHIEQALTKDQILELYLNKIALGYRSFGVGAAAEVYYGKTVDQLTLAEIAVIAGLPKAPSALNPIASPARAKARRAVVLGRMLDTGLITAEQYEEAKAAPIETRYHGPQVSFEAPYAAEMARDFLVKLVGEEEAYGAGYQVYTTVDARLQRAANRAVETNIYDYDERHGYRGPAGELWSAPAPQPERARIQAALANIVRFADLQPVAVIGIADKSITVLTDRGEELSVPFAQMLWARPFISDIRQGHPPKKPADVVKIGQQIWVRPVEDGWRLAQVPAVNGALTALDPRDGAIKAIVGGFSFNQSQFNRALQAKRQAGSNIKPFLYATALEDGMSLATIINDAPVSHYDPAIGVTWRPRNSPPEYEGPMRMRVALGKSKNVVSVRLLEMVGLDRFRKQMELFGFALADLPRVQSIALGSAEFTPIDMVRGFAAFANGGFRVEPYLVTKALDGDGNVIFEASPKVACEECTKAAAGDWVLEPNPALPPEQLAPRVIKATTAFLMQEALNSAIFGGGSFRDGSGWNGTGWRAGRALNRRDIGGKTGTTNESRDAWFSGFGPGIVASSWVGFDDHSRTLGSAAPHPGLPQQMSGYEFGAKSAMPAWIRFMQEALKDVPEKRWPMPAGIISVRIDQASGKLAGSGSSGSLFEYFARGSEPTEFAGDESAAAPFGSQSDDELF